jgi:outer membrane protein assembly factor BamB
LKLVIWGVADFFGAVNSFYLRVVLLRVGMKYCLNLVVAACVMLFSAVAIVGCKEGVSHNAALPRQSYEMQLREFMEVQRLTSLAPVRLLPADGEWGFLTDLLPTRSPSQSNGTSDFPFRGGFVVSDDVDVPQYRRCLSFGPFSIWRPLGESCLGEWLQNRADQQSSGVSWLRLNWSRRPQQMQSTSLNVSQSLATPRVITSHDAKHGDIAYVQNGSGVEAFAADGHMYWKNDEVGLGEIIDVSDLDADGVLDVVYAAHAKITIANSSATAPGSLYVLSADSGEVQWSYEFSNLEFGLNRYRTTIANIDGARTKSILATMTYSSSLMRFDFDRGVRNGRLSWRSEPFDYDSPDKAPLVVDLDGDGKSEVVSDSFGVIHAYDAASGKIKDSISYVNAATFGGFLQAQDIDGDGIHEVISVSNSVYYQGYVVVSWVDGGFVLRNKQTWGAGLDAAGLTVEVLDSLVPIDSGRPAGLVVSVTQGQEENSELQLIQPLTGEVLSRLAGHRPVYRLVSNYDSDDVFIATQLKSGAAVVRISGKGARPLSMDLGARWIGAISVRQINPVYRDKYEGYPGALIGADDTISLVAINSVAMPQKYRVSRVVVSAELTAHAVDQKTLVFSDGKRGYRASLVAGVKDWFVHSPRFFSTPIIADINGNGVRELVVPAKAGLARAYFSKEGLLITREVLQRAPQQSAEALYMPILMDEVNTSKRALVGFETLLDSDGVYRNFVSKYDFDNSKKWSLAVNRNNWEPSITALKSGLGGANIVLRDSRSTSLLNGTTGQVVWSYAIVGECQRQMAVADWDGDGVLDVAVQAGAVSLIHHGTTGEVLWSNISVGSYGAYSAFAQAWDKPPTLIQHNAGGLTIVNSQGVLRDLQIDERRIESRPVVIGRGSDGASDSIFQITGMGTLRAFDINGVQSDEAEFSVRVLAMSGAYIDGDDAVDLFIGTFDGELIAVSGATFKELWRLRLGGAVGTAVATDVDGDGRGEVVTITSDGFLHVIRQ